MKYINDVNAPQPVFDWLTHDSYDRGESTWSVTQLIDSPRVRLLKEKHDDEIVMPISKLLASRIGTAVHDSIERFTQFPFIAEQRVSVDRGGLVVSGAIDLQIPQATDIDTGEPNEMDLVDYKTCKAYAVIYGKPEWERQLNGYAWMLRKNGKEVMALYIFAFIMDWTAYQAKRNKDYPSANMQWIEVPLWSLQEQHEYFKNRIALHIETQANHILGQPLPECTPEERWMKDEKWAVMKNKNKRAIRNCDSLEDAQLLVSDMENADQTNDYWIEHRPGTPVRCEDYCPVAEFCDQYQKELASGKK